MSSKSKSHTIDQKVKQFILDNIDNSGYSDKKLKSNQEKIDFLEKTFYLEYGWSIDRYGLQQALIEWLMGLPPSVNLPFNYTQIIELAINIGYLDKDHTEKEANKILNNYWQLMANKIGQLFRCYHVPK